MLGKQQSQFFTLNRGKIEFWQLSFLTCHAEILACQLCQACRKTALIFEPKKPIQKKGM